MDMTNEVIFCARIIARDDNYEEMSIPEHVLVDLHATVSGDEDDKMAQYLREESATSPLRGAGITDGSMIIVRENDSLLVYARYFVEKPLTENQVGCLGEFTKGHFSDGAGDGFMQDLWHLHHIRFQIDTDSFRIANP